MQKRDDIVGYDFQGSPRFRMNLKEILIHLGGRCENDHIVFDLNSPMMTVYPRILEDDGMGYGVGDCFITEVDANESINEIEDINYINIFREPVPDKKTRKELLEKWDEEEKAVLESAKNFNKTSNK